MGQSGTFVKSTERRIIMRMDQYRGLNAWARKTVLKKEKVRQFGVNVFSDGRRKRYSRWASVPVARVQVVGTIKRQLGSGSIAPLHRYYMPGGKVYEEYVQEAPWSGGPVYHIALKDVRTGKPVPESLWTERELAEA
ncbi:MAG TPA: hypothetical protein V6D17_22820 [Candidatus Obscuribacterales bacterium]